MKKIGISTYLNTQPVMYPLQNGIIKPSFDLVEMLPHECSEKLLDKTLDAALIPSIELAKSKDDYFISDSFCISSRDMVKSVELFFKKDLEDIKTVALDSTSRTSALLTKIILEEKFEMEPEYIIMEPNIEKMFEKADAALIIADNALELYTDYPNRFDLAEEWYDMTGLPFVFAILAGYEGSLEPVDHDIFKRSLEYGTSHLDEICKDWHKKHPKFTVPFYKDYLKENIRFEFGEEEKKGLNLFYDYAFLRNEISFFPEMKFYKSE